MSVLHIDGSRDDVVQAFLDVEVVAEGELSYLGSVHIDPRATIAPTGQHPTA